MGLFNRHREYCPFSVGHHNLELVNSQRVKTGAAPILQQEIPGGLGCILNEGESPGGNGLIGCSYRGCPDSCGLLDHGDFCQVQGIGVNLQFE